MNVWFTRKIVRVVFLVGACALIAIGVIGPQVQPMSALAAPGDPVDRITLASIGRGVGLTFDGSRFWITDAMAPSNLYSVDSFGVTRRTIVFPGFDFGGLGFDGSDIWAGGSTGIPLNGELYKINRATGAMMSRVPVALSSGLKPLGLSYDIPLSQLWFSTDSPMVSSVTPAGTPTGGFIHPSFRYDGQASDGVCLYHHDDHAGDVIVKTRRDGTTLATYPLPSSGGDSYADLAFDDVSHPVPVVWAVHNLSGSGSELVAIEVSRCPVPPLSVHWDYYRASCTPDGPVLVEWGTLSESDTVGFEVLHADNSMGPYVSIGFVDAHGPYTPYAFYDTRPMPGQNWYKIQEYTSEGIGDVTPPFTTPYVCSERCSNSQGSTACLPDPESSTEQINSAVTASVGYFARSGSL